MDAKDLTFFYNYGSSKNATALVDAFASCDKQTIVEAVLLSSAKEVRSENIPQFGTITNSTFGLIEYLEKSGDFGPTFLEIGVYYRGPGKTEKAYKKYGENRAKLCAQLGLVKIQKVNRSCVVFLTDIGRAFGTLSAQGKLNCLTVLAGGIPIVQECIRRDIKSKEETKILLEEYLSEKTAERRCGNVWELVSIIRSNNEF